MHKVKSKKRRQELTASFYGLTKHADCKNLFYKLTGKHQTVVTIPVIVCYCLLIL